MIEDIQGKIMIIFSLLTTSCNFSFTFDLSRNKVELLLVKFLQALHLYSIQLY
jgi:hypothetical protein